MAMDQPCYTLINTGQGEFDPPSEQDLKKLLESNKVQNKIDGLKEGIAMLMNGERLPSLLMTVIRYVMPCDDHTVKKLLLIFWEIVPKYGGDGKLLHEMILVCDAYRKDLQHPNEYVRGSTLRFLCKLREPELLEPLMPAIQECLAHHHSYVRRNAVLAIYTIYKNFSNLIPDGPELIHTFIQDEADASCKRNAFIMLSTTSQPLALQYLSTCIDQVNTFNEILQLVVVELVHKVCRTDASQRAKFIRVIYNLLDSASAAVRYDAAGTLLTLSTAPTAVSAAAKCYIDLIVNESDNNVKLIVLERLVKLRDSPANERVLQDLAMEILRVLQAPDLEVREKTLQLTLDLVSGRNANEIIAYLKKELAKTSQESFEKTGEYRQLLVRTLHALGVRYPELAPGIVPQLMEFLSDPSDGGQSAINVILFVREAFESLAEMRGDMLDKLLEGFGEIKSDRVVRATLWILGEYAGDRGAMERVMEAIKRALGALPIVEHELREAAEAEAEDDESAQAPKVVTRTRITADGTYATESVYTSLETTKKERPSLRQLFMDGEFFVASSLAACLTKLSLRYARCGASAAEANSFKAQAMLMLASVLHLGRSGLPQKAMGQDTQSRVMSCVRVISSDDAALHESFLSGCHSAFANMLAAHNAQLEAARAKERAGAGAAQQTEADALISFRALRTKEEGAGEEDDFDFNVSRATGASDSKDLSSKLSKVVQLSGFSDPVYVEAYVHVHQYDILLDVLVVNQTADTLQNLTLELATLGDLKLTEKPASYTVGAHDFCNIKANVKVSSTESGFIFGSIVYDISGAASDRSCVILNDIHIDILDYITPSSCTDVQFRDMWSAFEWENKVTVRTGIADLREFLEHIMRVTNMKCLTPETALAGECNYLAANLYARSVFGEDALANLSIEKLPDGQLTGHVRIRSKTQGIAISIGDKITRSQKDSAQQ